jgi:GAF domain-containing protein
MTDKLRSHPSPNPMINPALELEASQGWPTAVPPQADLALFQRYSHLIVAILDAGSLSLRWMNDHFCQLTGISPQEHSTADAQAVLSLFSPTDQQALRQLYRRHMLQAVLQHRYQQPDLVGGHLLDEPVVVSLTDVRTQEVRRLELRLRSEQITVDQIQPAIATALDKCWGAAAAPTPTVVSAQLHDLGSPLAKVIDQLQPDTYAVSGGLLLEGIDVTERELSKSLIRRLIDQDSVLQPQKFDGANRLIKRLFRASDSLILSAENDKAKLFMGLDQPTWEVHTYPVKMLQSSLFFQATDQNQVLNIPDLQVHSPTDCERQILQHGVRSLLIVPIVMKSMVAGSESRKLFGLVGVTSQQPYAFDSADCRLATDLIPALTAAMRHTIKDRFTNIHPSVRWRFEQEAERRSWGLPPEPIVFQDVYPLYGISDIRGSSDQRNRAIQADLQKQFELGLAVVEALCAAKDNAFAQQFCLDLRQHLETLKSGITVDAEVTLIRYLQTQLEAHFSAFIGISPEVEAAIDAYRSNCDPEHQCVYQARAEYDRVINQINTRLRDIWSRWQKSLQTITRHYCDIESTDGIDHMIYAGQSIDADFSSFHLRSLRYEQLRAVCDCARESFRMKQEFDTALDITHLVLVQDTTVDISHDEHTERLFDVRGTRDTRYEIVKKRIDKAVDSQTRDRITQPGMLTVVYSTTQEWDEYRQYLDYLEREGLIGPERQLGTVEPLQGVTGLKFARVTVLPEAKSPANSSSEP